MKGAARFWSLTGLWLASVISAAAQSHGGAAEDVAGGNACWAAGAIGVSERPGRLHISWENDTTLRIDTDAGTQTRLPDFGPAPEEHGAPSWQGDSSAEWQFSGRAMLDLGGLGFVAGGGPDPGAPPSGTLKVVTTNLLPGYLRKNGVPYSGNAVLTEYFNRLAGREGDRCLLVAAVVDDPAYLRQPSVRTYTFKAAGLDGLESDAVLDAVTRKALSNRS